MFPEEGCLDRWDPGVEQDREKRHTSHTIQPYHICSYMGTGNVYCLFLFCFLNLIGKHKGGYRLLNSIARLITSSQPFCKEGNNDTYSVGLCMTKKLILENIWA